jgi:hypothetical protein
MQRFGHFRPEVPEIDEPGLIRYPRARRDMRELTEPPTPSLAPEGSRIPWASSRKHLQAF